MSQYNHFFALVNRLGWSESEWRDFVSENTNGRSRSIKSCNEAEYAQIISLMQTACQEPKLVQSSKLIAKIHALCYELNFTKAGAKQQIIIDTQQLDNFLIKRSQAKKPLSAQNNSELYISIHSLQTYLKSIINKK
jgi:hypothetical protein